MHSSEVVKRMRRSARCRHRIKTQFMWFLSPIFESLYHYRLPVFGWSSDAVSIRFDRHSGASSCRSWAGTTFRPINSPIRRDGRTLTKAKGKKPNRAALPPPDHVQSLVLVDAGASEVMTSYCHSSRRRRTSDWWSNIACWMLFTATSLHPCRRHIRSASASCKPCCSWQLGQWKAQRRMSRG